MESYETVHHLLIFSVVIFLWKMLSQEYGINFFLNALCFNMKEKQQFQISIKIHVTH